MADISDLRWAIVPKSDQLNAEQLLSGAMTLEVSDVRIGSDDQPIVIHYRDDNGRPYKPCKTMRKLLIFAWGEDGRRWVGRAMTVYNDPSVRFGGIDVGGIRISHLSDIPREVRVSLTATKGKKALHTVQPLKIERGPDHLALIGAAGSLEELQAAFTAAVKSTRDTAQRAEYTAAKDARKAALTSFAARVAACQDLAALQVLSDEAEAMPAGPERDEALRVLAGRDRELA